MTSNHPRKGKVSIKESEAILRKLNLVIGEILPVFYEYNNKIRHLGIYLKPVHIVTRRAQDGSIVKYHYYGRYWYKLDRSPDGRLRWIYIGKEKPLSSLPDPPANPLEGVVVKKYNDTVEIIFASERLFKAIYDKLFSEPSRG